jgi:hypothetical protein
MKLHQTAGGRTRSAPFAVCRDNPVISVPKLRVHDLST